MGREIIGIAPCRRFADLDQTFVNTALEIGIDQAERDAEFGGKPTLRLRAAPLHRLKQAQHDPGFFGIGCLGRTRHLPPREEGQM